MAKLSTIVVGSFLLSWSKLTNFFPMDFNSILENYKIRIALGVTVGIFAKFLSDVIFSLLYRFYPLFQPVGGYVLAIIISYVFYELYYFTEKRINKTLKWTDNSHKRFWIQLGYTSIITVVVVLALRFVLVFLVSGNTMILVLDESIILAGSLILCLAYNLLALSLVLLNKWRFTLAENERFKKENAEFKFEVLRNQINPHFLFNSLNTLSSVMYENVDTAANFIRRLSEVYRYVLENRQKDLVTLETELKFIEAYKYLFELRFTDRLMFKINIDSKLNDMLIAPMTIQLLVENAVKHNVISAKKPLEISIFSDADKLIVSNNYQYKPVESYSSGMGLKNIKSQYAFFTKRLVEIENTSDKFTVRIPLLLKSETKKND